MSEWQRPVELEALKRAYAEDLENRDLAFALVAAELRRRLADEPRNAWLELTLRDLADDVWQILDESDFDAYEEGFRYGEFPIDSGEIWQETATNLLTFCDNDWGCDHLSIMDFGDGLAFIAHDSNSERGLNDYEIEGEIDLQDTAAVRGLVRLHLRLALSIGDHLGRCPDEIGFDDPVTGDDIRSTTVGLFVANVTTAEEYAAWMAERDHGIWPIATEDERAALADAYLEVALGYSPTEYSAELDPDEGGGVLLSELLESGMRDLERISDQLDELRDEQAGRDASESHQ